MRVRVTVWMLLLACGSALPVLAHHSFAMFDRGKTAILEGTVKEFQWTNPHAWLQLTVSKGGRNRTFSLEAQSPNLLVRRGWKPDVIRTGDKVSVKIYPLRDGTDGGQLISVTRADGKTFATAY